MVGKKEKITTETNRMYISKLLDETMIRIAALTQTKSNEAVNAMKSYVVCCLKVVEGFFFRIIG